MVLLMRVAALFLAGLGLIGVLASFDRNAEGESQLWLLILFLPMLASAVWLFVKARKMARHDAQIALTRKLLELSKESGLLTVAHVEVNLSLTADEAKAALSQLSHDGLAQFDVDAEGMPVYRVQRLPGPG